MGIEIGRDRPTIWNLCYSLVGLCGLGIFVPMFVDEINGPEKDLISDSRVIDGQKDESKPGVANQFDSTLNHLTTRKNTLVVPEEK